MEKRHEKLHILWSWKIFKGNFRKNELDIDDFDLSEFSNAKEASQTLGISESTANNWLSRRTDISKLGDQAIAYQLMLNMVKAHSETPKSNILVKNEEEYTIYREKSDGEHEFLAKTNDVKLARTIKEINKVFNLLVFCEKFISEELKTKENYFSDDELQPCNIGLTNLRDTIYYISKGESLSQIIDKRRQEMKDELDKMLSPITLSTNNTKLNKEEIVISLKNEASDDLVDNKKLYDICIPKGALLRYKPDTTKSPYLNYKGVALYVKKLDKEKYITYKVEKDGTDWVDYKDSFGKNNLGNEYKSLRSAFQAILYTKSKSLNETEETEYSIDDGKTWKQTRELKISQSDYNKLVEKIISEHLREDRKN